MHAEDARSGERREPLDLNSTSAKVSIASWRFVKTIKEK